MLGEDLFVFVAIVVAATVVVFACNYFISLTMSVLERTLLNLVAAAGTCTTLILVPLMMELSERLPPGSDPVRYVDAHQITIDCTGSAIGFVLGAWFVPKLLKRIGCKG